MQREIARVVKGKERRDRRIKAEKKKEAKLAEAFAVNFAGAELEKNLNRIEAARQADENSLVEKELLRIEPEERFRKLDQIYGRLIRLGFQERVHGGKEIPESARIFNLQPSLDGKSYAVRRQTPKGALYTSFLSRNVPLNILDFIEIEKGKEGT